MNSASGRAPRPQRRLDVVDHGVVINHGDTRFADEHGARDVWVFEHEGTFFAHYDAAGPEGWRAALATSSNGIDWVKHGPILPLGQPGELDSASASYGTVYRDGADWHMFYLGTPNATPDDLKTPSFPYATMKARGVGPFGPWAKQPTVTPFSPTPGTYYSDTASPGQVVRVGDRFLMLFSASRTTSSGEILRTLGTAWTTDLDGSWAVDPEPLLPENEQIENSSLYFEESSSLWYLFTNHIGVRDEGEAVLPQGTAEYTDAIWVYWSDRPDRFSVDQKALVLDEATCSWSPRVIGLPSAVRIGDRLALYYDGCAIDTTGHGGRDIGVAFVSLPIMIQPAKSTAP